MATALSSLMIALLFGEIFLRLIAPLPSANHHQLFCEFDDTLGWKKIPDFTGTHRTEEYEVQEYFNSKGLRGPEFTYQKPTDHKRVLVLGDSYVEGYMVSYEETFLQVCEAKLQTRCAPEKYQVINAGTGGYATDQELLFYQQEGVKYHPDITVLMVCINDIWFNNQPKYWRGQKPLFRVEADSIRLTNVPLLAPEDLGGIARLKRWSLENIQLARRLKILKDKIETATTGVKVPEDLKAYQRTYDADLAAAWTITEHLLKALKLQADNIDSRFIIGFIPEKEAIYPATWDAFKTQYEITDQDYDPLRLQKKLEKICKEMEIPFFDPTPALTLTSTANPQEDLYYEFDSHWNAKGMQVVGEALTEFLGCM